ncbi:MAG: ABC-F family ATP-binding cassette domain-containing protein [Acidobacteria bacterium]|nr:ABC-F family ATP-binding cassette domain-containing protein [Acidobacteriota bacterium]
MLFRLSDVYKGYSAREILRGVSFQVNKNEKIGLVGRNGAGKTTVFKLVTGEEAADSGEVIKINGLTVGLLAQHVDFHDSDTVHTSALSAFQKIHDIEAEMRRLEVEMATDATDEILTRYSELQHEFEIEDGFTYTARAEAILLGLGFPRETWDLKTANLSGGQKNRLGLARLLLANTDILLLDEPTNHLDVEAVEWLEDFLKSYDRTFVLISHDRYFLDRTCNRIIELELGRAVSYKGNYSEFLVERELRREQQRREFENQQAMIAKTEEFIRRNLEGQKTKQAKSRRTLLRRMDRIEAVSSDKPSGNFNLRKVERAGQNVLAIEDLAIGYGEKILAKDITLTLTRGECLGIIGGNGTGKTTFLKTILGTIREISGKMLWGVKTSIGYYSQNLDDLEPRNEIIQELRRVAPNAENGELRGFLARFLFSGDDVFKRVGDLSGGEKGRLALAKLIYSNFNVLVLDEPTNHLDIPSREALEAALDEFEGTIIAVSHDRFFLDKISTQVLAFEPDGSIEVYNGNYSDYHDWKESRRDVRSRERTSPTASETAREAGSPSNLDARRDDAEPVPEKPSNPLGLSKNQLQRIESRICEIEREIPKREDELAKLGLEMSLPEIASDHARLAASTARYATLETAIQKLYEEWDDLSARL